MLRVSYENLRGSWVHKHPKLIEAHDRLSALTAHSSTFNSDPSEFLEHALRNATEREQAKIERNQIRCELEKQFDEAVGYDPDLPRSTADLGPLLHDVDVP